MKTLWENQQYKEWVTELKICKIGGLFLVLYQDPEIPKQMINLLKQEEALKGFLQFEIDLDENKLQFPILFEQTFEQIGDKTNIFHLLNLEANLLPEAVNEFINYLQYGRERLKAKSYSLVFWISPALEKTLFLQAPDFYHWVFGIYDFTEVNPQELINLDAKINHSDVFQQIENHFKRIIWQYENWEMVKESEESFLVEPMGRRDLYRYYVQGKCLDKDNQVFYLDNASDQFLANEKQSFLTLLGDFGTGKSSFLVDYYVKLAQRYLADNNNRVPVFLSLKDYKGKINLETLIITEFYQKFGIEIDLLIFQQLALSGKFIFCIDGFDEMATLTDQTMTLENFEELTKLSFETILFLTHPIGKPCKVNKILLTSRTHYFLTEGQEKEILQANYTILYRNYATRSKYQITRMRFKEFEYEQIRLFIDKHTNNPEKTEEYLKIIQDTYNLRELSERPLLLDMIITTIPQLASQQTEINAASLYQAYTAIWIERDDWRSQLLIEGKRQFMYELAVNMYQLGGDFSLHYSLLKKPDERYLKPNFENQDEDYYLYEVTTCSFLNRDDKGNYKFIHKSFMEYFIAEFIIENLKKKETRILYKIDFNKEIKYFLGHQIKSENIGIKNWNLNNVNLSGINLSDADLCQIQLIRANLNGVNLSNANLSSSYLHHANLSGAILYSANLNNVNLRSAKLNNSDLSKANLCYAYLNNADLRGANLSGANLSGADLSNADLRGANLSGANLSNADLSKIKNKSLEKADLSYVYLSYVNLSYANLSNANLRNTNLSNANLSNANLRNTDLSNANLRNTNLSNADLTGATLSNADFTIQGTQVHNTRFIDVIGIRPRQKQYLIRRGAIFEDS